MTEEGHRHALEELRASRARLRPVEDIRSYTELSFGMAVHVIAIGSQRQHGQHRDQHEGLSRWLRRWAHDDVAEALTELEALRIGRWYGRQGNGNTAARIDALLAQLEAWALA